MQSLKKKYAKVKDWKYLSQLYKQCEEDKRAIEKMEKDNRKLQGDQKKAEFKLARKVNTKNEQVFNNEIVHPELVELDNEMKVLRHKADYLQEKQYKDTELEKE